MSYDVQLGPFNVAVDRVALTIGGFQIYWYGIIIAFGFIAALIYGFKRANSLGIKTDPLVDVILVGTIFAVIGARVYYIVNSPGKFNSFAEIIDIRDGGLAFYGGLIGAILGGALVCAIRRIDFRSVADLAGISFLIGQSIGRWGNFMNQEAFGINTTLPWGMYSQRTHDYLLNNFDTTNGQFKTGFNPNVAVHPCFLYESLWNLVGFVLIHFLSKKLPRFKGEVFLYYIVWYGFGRFFIEGLRTDSLYFINTGFRVSQIIALACVIIGLVLIVVFRIKAKQNIDDVELAVDGTCSDAACLETPTEQVPTDETIEKLKNDLQNNIEKED